MTNLSIFFTVRMNLIAKLLDFYQKCFDFVHFLLAKCILENKRMAQRRRGVKALRCNGSVYSPLEGGQGDVNYMDYTLKVDFIIDY